VVTPARRSFRGCRVKRSLASPRSVPAAAPHRCRCRFWRRDRAGGATELLLPVLLDLPAPRLRAYPRETVIAEKFQAMVALGRANSRMKDFYDIWLLSHAYEFKDDGLARAIAATFARRKTAIPAEPPYALTRAFADDRAKQQQWASFAEAIGAELPPLAEIVDDLAGFLMPRAAEAGSLE
jgi:hypothetical protein